ncbi:hypothetical protein BCEN4_1920004 [Burkholderia cenocepacia]|nr:hypothetical protein BCEN4_1920004 [Burkholderia cenocepacia]
MPVDRIAAARAADHADEARGLSQIAGPSAAAGQ